MVNIDSTESLQVEKDALSQEETQPIVEVLDGLGTNDSATSAHDPRIKENLLDAKVIEDLASTINRPSARAHLDDLVERLRSS